MEERQSQEGSQPGRRHVWEQGRLEDTPQPQLISLFVQYFKLVKEC
jgi:hypothetical protein